MLYEVITHRSREEILSLNLVDLLAEEHQSQARKWIEQVVADDEDRENEGDLVAAAELVTPDLINFMTREGRGLICLTLTPDRCDRLGLAQIRITSYNVCYTKLLRTVR